MHTKIVEGKMSTMYIIWDSILGDISFTIYSKIFLILLSALEGKMSTMYIILTSLFLGTLIFASCE